MLLHIQHLLALGPAPIAKTVHTFWDHIIVTLVSGERIKLPYSYSEIVCDASPYQRMAVTPTLGGRMISWPGLGVTISVAQILTDAATGETQWDEPPGLMDASQ